MLGLDVLGILEVFKVPGLLFVAKEFCCLKLDTCSGGGTWGPRLSTGAFLDAPPSQWRKLSLGASSAAYSASSSSEAGGLQALCLPPHRLIVEADVWMRLVGTWVVHAVVVVAPATQGYDPGLVAASDCHTGDSQLVPSPADVRVVGVGVSRSAAAERGEVLVLLVECSSCTRLRLRSCCGSVLPRR